MLHILSLKYLPYKLCYTSHTLVYYKLSVRSIPYYVYTHVTGLVQMGRIDRKMIW